MKLTITKIVRSDKDKNGNPLKSKDGRPYTRLAIKTKEHGDKWISGFAGSWNFDWAEGMVVGADVEPNGEYLNLKKPDPLKLIEERLAKLEEAVFNQGPEIGGHVEDDNLPF